MLSNKICLCLIVLSLSFVSCSEKLSIRHRLHRFESSIISFPDKLVKHEDNNTYPQSIPKGYRLILYVSPEECSSCYINQLNDNIELFQLGDSLGFTTMVILSPLEEDVEKTISYLIKSKPSFPVWIDTDGSFRRLNQHIPQDIRFHSFLIDERGRPVLVGNPLYDTFRNLLISSLNY